MLDVKVNEATAKLCQYTQPGVPGKFPGGSQMVRTQQKGDIFISNPIISHRNCNQMIAFSNRKCSHIREYVCGVCVCSGRFVCVLVDKRRCENGRQNESQLVLFIFFFCSTFCFHLFVLLPFCGVFVSFDI